MRRKKRLGLLLALALAAGVLSGCTAETPEQDEDTRPLIVVGVDSYPPYTSMGALLTCAGALLAASAPSPPTPNISYIAFFMLFFLSMLFLSSLKVCG